MWKGTIPHAKEIRVDTLKAINYMKSTHNPILKGKPIKRLNDVLKSWKPQFDRLRSIDRSKPKYKFGMDISNAFEDDSFQSESNIMIVDNKKLRTPYFRLISKVKDGSNILKEQINQSVDRMKAARNGHSIENIFKDYDYSFYLPEKWSYITKNEAKIRRIDSGSSINTSFEVRNKSKIFQTELDYENPQTIRVSNTKRSTTSLNSNHNKSQSLTNNTTRIRELKK